MTYTRQDALEEAWVQLKRINEYWELKTYPAETIKYMIGNVVYNLSQTIDRTNG